MNVGISMIYKRVDQSAPNPGTFAQECEQLGLESVWVGDHGFVRNHPTLSLSGRGNRRLHRGGTDDGVSIL